MLAANIILLVAVVVISFFIKCDVTPNKTGKSSCAIDSNHACNSLSGAALDPVNDASYNLKQVVIQMLLLEDHLFHKEKQCSSCIKKHVLMIEGLADEGITLDTTNKFKSNFEAVLETMSNIEGIYKTNPALAAQRVRELRREIIDRI